MRKVSKWLSRGYELDLIGVKWGLLKKTVNVRLHQEWTPPSSLRLRAGGGGGCGGGYRTSRISGIKPASISACWTSSGVLPSALRLRRMMPHARTLALLAAK